MLRQIKFLTAGESHGKGLLGILDGIPAGLEISEKYIGRHLQRRQMGYGRGGRMKIESDYAEIWSGIRHGKTIGAPVGLIIKNKDWKNWTKKMSINPVEGDIRKVTLPRPGHADLAGVQKYGFDAKPHKRKTIRFTKAQDTQATTRKQQKKTNAK